jgi:hypothetical protein
MLREPAALRSGPRFHRRKQSAKIPHKSFVAHNKIGRLCESELARQPDFGLEPDFTMSPPSEDEECNIGCDAEELISEPRMDQTPELTKADTKFSSSTSTGSGRYIENAETLECNESLEDDGPFSVSEL